MQKFRDGFYDVWEAPQNALGKHMAGLWWKRLITLDDRELEHLYGLEALLAEILGYKVTVIISDYYSHKADKVLGKISGFSIGRYICLNSAHDIETLKHELGHCKQSREWGWLYLVVIGLPSSCHNMWDRKFHKHWDDYDRQYWYYIKKWTERMADKKGKVKRREKLAKIPRHEASRYPPMENQVAA